MESEQSITEAEGVDDVLVSSPSSRRHALEPLVPQQDDQPCPTCGNPTRMNPNGSATASFVYALGRIEPRFPSIGVEKEFAQATGRAVVHRRLFGAVLPGYGLEDQWQGCLILYELDQPVNRKWPAAPFRLRTLEE